MFSFQSILKQVFISIITGALGVFLGLDINRSEKNKASQRSALYKAVLSPISATLPEDTRTCIVEKNESEMDI